MAKFSDVIGKEAIKEYLARSIAQGTVSHAYLIDGEKGAGKLFLARVFAQALLCEAVSGSSTGPGTEAEACGVCHACKQAESGTHPDLKIVEHLEGKKSLTVKDIRAQIVDDVITKPYYGPYKVYIVPDAEAMTAEAQNALLKTFEEPPSYCVIMLLTTGAEGMLSTIRSRAVSITVRPLSDADIAAFLSKEYQLPDYQARRTASFARGNPGQALALLTDEAFEERRKGTLKLLNGIGDYGADEVKRAVESLAVDKDDPAVRDAFLNFIQYYLRDLMVFKATENEEYLIFGEELSYISSVARACTYPRILKGQHALDETRERLRSNVGETWALEMLMLELREVLG